MLEIETRVLQMLTLSREEDVPWLRLSPISISNLCVIYIYIYIYIDIHLVIVVLLAPGTCGRSLPWLGTSVLLLSFFMG